MIGVVDRGFILKAIFALAPYAGISLYIAALSLVFSLILGGTLTAFALSRSPILRGVTKCYVYILRSTPSIVLLFIIFYGIPKVVSSFTGSYFYGAKPLYVILTLSLLGAASMSEVLRAAYLSVDIGQLEAALSLGISRPQAVRLIVLPQAAIVALPSIVNSTTALVKEGALAYTIGLIDLMGRGEEIVLKNFGAYSVEVYIALAVIFWAINASIEALAAILETRLSIWRALPFERERV